MNQLLQPGQAGTLESNDIIITVAPVIPGAGITSELISPVIKQYGARIQEVIREALAAQGITDALVHALVHQVFQPTAKEIDNAKRILAAYDEALEKKSGVIALAAK